MACFATAASAQFSTRYYSDTNTSVTPYKLFHTQYKSGHFYSYALTKTSPNNNINVVVKTDTSGNVKWTAYPYNYAFKDTVLPFNGTKYSFQMITGMDNSVYLMNISDSTWINYNNIEWISRIDDATGVVLWTRKLRDYTMDEYYLRIADYSSTELLYSSFHNSSNIYRIAKMAKSDGSVISTINIPVGPHNFDNVVGNKQTQQLYVAPNKNLYIFTADSVYKITSFENPTLEWKSKFGVSSYTDIKRAWEDNGLLYIAGSKNYGFESGLITAVNMNTGAIAWQQNITPSYDMNFRDAKIKNGKLYSTWQHRYVGSILEKTYVSSVNALTGALNWSNNYEFNSDTTIPIAANPQAMLYLEVDDAEMLYLTGYVPHPVNQQQDWGFMKIKGSNGQILAKKRLTQLSNATYADDQPYGLKLLNGKLYSPGFRSIGTSPDKQIEMHTLDTAVFNLTNTTVMKPSVQYHSVVTGIRDFSVAKRIMVKNIGRTLVAEMTDRNLNTLWKKELGNGVDYYYSEDVMTVNPAKKIFIAAKRFKAVSGAVLNEFKDASGQENNDSTFIFELDSTGLLVKTYKYADNGLLTPVRLVYDTGFAKTFFEYNYSWETYKYSFATGEGTWGTSTPKNFAGRVAFIKPRNFYVTTNDTLVYIKTVAGPSQLVKTKWMVSGTPVSYRTLNKGIRIIYDIEHTSGSNFYIVGQDSLNQDFTASLNTATGVFRWFKTGAGDANSIKIFSRDSSLYKLVKTPAFYSIQKISATDGGDIWSRPITLPANMVLTVNDFVLNRSRHRISLTGTVVDTMDFPNKSKVFMLTMDTLGNEISRIMRDGDKPWLNEGKFLYVDKDGETVTGGRINYSTYNYAGFVGLVNASTPANDLTFSSVSVSPNSVAMPATITATFTEQNLGNDATAPHKVRFYLSADNVLTPGSNGDILLGSYDMNTVYTNPQTSGAINVALQPGCSIAAGNYYVFFQTDADNNISETNETNNTATAAITILAGGGLPAIPTIAANPGTTACAGTTVTLTATSASCSGCTFNWSNGATGPVTSVTTTGAYSITATNGCGSSSASVIISFSPSPTVVVNANTTNACGGDTVTLTGYGADSYTWSGPGLISTTGTTVKAAPSVSGSHTYTATGTRNGCSSTGNIVVTYTAKPVFVITPNDTTICAGQSVTLQATGNGNYYYWTPPTGLSGSTGASVIATPATTTTYTATANNNGCLSQKSRTITVVPAPTPSVTMNFTGCPGNVLTFTATSVNGGSSPAYFWFVNNNVAGLGQTFILSNAVNGSQVYVKMVPSACATLSSVNSAVTTVSCVTTALPTISGLQEFSVSPNPSRGIFYVHMKLNTVKTVNFRLMNEQGVIMQTYDPVRLFGSVVKKFEAGNIAAGLYYLEIRSGNERMIEKIVIAR